MKSLKPLHHLEINKYNKNSKICTVVHQNKIGQSVTLDSFTIQRFV
jgi:hypothetical protein